MHVNLQWKSNAGSELRSRPGTGIPFPIMRGGNLPEAWILSYTGRPTKKIHGDYVPSGRPIDFGSTPGTGQIKCYFKFPMRALIADSNSNSWPEFVVLQVVPP